METNGKNYVAKLNEFVQKNRCELRYDDVGSEGPAHIKTFTQRVILNGELYPDGVGGTKKEAKQNAAKHALNALLEKEQSNAADSGLPESHSLADFQPKLTQPNFICWLNEQSQKNKVSLKAEESTAIDQGHAAPGCRFVVGDRKYPVAYGRTKREAKEEAAKLVHQDIFGNQTSQAIDDNLNVETSRNQTNDATTNQDDLGTSDKLKNLEVSPKEHHLGDPDFIGILNRFCQKTNRSLDFSLVRKCGLAHCPQFFYKILVDGKAYPEVDGKTAKEAKQKAAQLAWSALQEQSDGDSKGSVKSEEDASSSVSTTPTGWVCHDSTPQKNKISDSDSVIFKSSSTAPKEENVVAKPKRKIAATFLKLENPKQDTNPNLQTVNTADSSSPNANLSRFLTEFDQIEHVGKGGFGRVYKAKQIHLSCYFAVKIVRCKGKALREAGTLANLQHDNIVRYYSSWIENSDYKFRTADCSSTSQSSTDASVPYLYIQMELCEKGTLKDWIDKRNACSDPSRRVESLAIIRKIVCGVEYIHSKHLIHRDLKPPNIMFSSDEEVKIGDFGLVTEDNEDDENLLERTTNTGTKSFMAPEQRSQKMYDKKVDIFALGLIYFEMLYKMFTGQEKAKVWSNVRNQILPEGFPQTFPGEHVIICEMLDGNPERRPHAKELKQSLGNSDFLQ